MQRPAVSLSSDGLGLAPATATGTPFDVTAAVADVGVLLGLPIPTAGPTSREGDPDTGEWTGSQGAHFRISPLWESRDYVSVPGAEWDAAQEEVEQYLAALATDLGKSFGKHQVVSMRAYLLHEVPQEEFPPLIAEICAFSLYGDLLVWGPVTTPRGERWVVISASQCNDDAPHIMFAAVSDEMVRDPDSD
jgi:hypothetical protein